MRHVLVIVCRCSRCKREFIGLASVLVRSKSGGYADAGLTELTGEATHCHVSGGFLVVAFELPTFAHTCAIVQCEKPIFPCTIHYIPVQIVIRFTLLAFEAG